MDMSKAFNIDGIIGLPSLDSVSLSPLVSVGKEAKFKTSSGEAMAMYLQAGKGGVAGGDVCIMTTPNTMQPAPITPGKGAAVFVACATIPADNFGWFISSGTVPVTTIASTTIGGPVYLGAIAGQSSPTATNGVQVLGATYAETKTIATPDTVLVSLQSASLQGQTA